MTEAATTTPESGAPTPTTNQNPAPSETPATEFKSEESKQAVLADLAKERDARQALEQQLNELRTAQQAQTQALAEAFGLGEQPKGEDLAETVATLKAQFEASQRDAERRVIIAEHQIPADYHDLLTETDTEKLKAQAEKVAALVAAQGTTAPEPPAFQANPGQGRGGDPSPTAAEDAEYERFYPTPNRK